MTMVLIALVGLVAVIVIGGGGALAFLNSQKKRADRDDRFRVAILSRKMKIEGVSARDASHPDVYIARREIQEIEKRYLDGKENPE